MSRRTRIPRAAVSTGIALTALGVAGSPAHANTSATVRLSCDFPLVGASFIDATVTTQLPPTTFIGLTLPASNIPMTYAGSTGSLPAHKARPPIPNKARRMNFVSSSETRPPYRRKNRGVRKGSTTNSTADTTTKTSVRSVNGEKMSPRARTVPRSFTKHAARMALPYSVTLNPSSSMTA